jgi:hypothetical protein
MLARRLAAVPLTLLIGGLLAGPAGAAPKLKASAALLRAGDATTLEVKLTSKRKFTAATRPRSVKVSANGTAYTLKRAVSKPKAMTWRSPALTGPAAQALEALGGTKRAITVRTKSGKRTLRTTVAPAPSGSTTPAPGGGNTTPPPTSGPTLVRNDEAGRAAMGAGDLMLEWAEFGASGRTAEYRRIWFYENGSFRLNVINWNDVSGEICDKTFTGTWVFKEGYTTEASGGGVVVKVGITANGTTGDDVLGFPNGNTSAVYVGTNGQRYDKNPNMAQNC